MTSEEYNNAIYNIVISGRGYKAITDISSYLENLKKNVDSAIREIRAEQKAMRKIINSEQSNKSKIQTIEGLLFGSRVEEDDES